MTEKVRDLSWLVSSSRALSCSRYWHRETAAIVFAGFFYWKWRRMGRTEGRERSGGRGKIRPFYASAGSLIRLMLIGGPLPAFAIELSAPQEALYTTVSIFPPSANSMTVCYGFVCRRREILDFTPGDRNALTQILAAGRASAAAEKAAVQKGLIWFDPRMGPPIGADKTAPKTHFPHLDARAKYHCWDTTPHTTTPPLVLHHM